VRSCASLFKFQYLLFYLTSSSSCLRLLPRLLCPSNFYSKRFKRRFPRKITFYACRKNATIVHLTIDKTDCCCRLMFNVFPRSIIIYPFLQKAKCLKCHSHFINFNIYIYFILTVKVYVNFIPEQAIKAQRGSRVLFFFFNFGARWGWVVNVTPRPL
jgi:hypothetical protein